MIVIENIKTGEKFMFPEADTFPIEFPTAMIPLGFKKSDDQTPVPLHFENRVRWEAHSRDPLNLMNKWSDE